MQQDLIHSLKACQDNMPYIFVSYSHKDREIVFSIIEKLQHDGYRIWFDEGIEPGTAYDNVIAEHIKNCGYFISFTSTNFFASDYCTSEIYYALNQKKELLPICLDETEFPAGLGMRLSKWQYLYWYEYPNKEAFYEKLYRVQQLQNFRQVGIIDKNPLDNIINIPDTLTDIHPAEKAELHTQPGDIIQVGKWEGKPIDWIVLRISQNGWALLLSKYALEQKPYNSGNSAIWSECTLRGYLQDEFIPKVFNEQERRRILTAKNKNLIYRNNKICDEGLTRDWLFLLSTDEYQKYRTAYPLNIYAACKNLNGTPVWWWLRSPGFIDICAANVNSYGFLNQDGLNVHHISGWVRPAFYYNLQA